MQNGNDQTKRAEEQDTGPWEDWMPCGTRGSAVAGCCGMGDGAIGRRSRCGSFFKANRFAVFGVLTGMALMFFIAVTGSVLGIVAFIRTF